MTREINYCIFRDFYLPLNLKQKIKEENVVLENEEKINSVINSGIVSGLKFGLGGRKGEMFEMWGNSNKVVKMLMVFTCG
jgi:hypothetical protein